MENSNQIRFYENKLFIWALLFILPPVGILMMWIVRTYHVYLRISLSILFGLLFLNFLGMEASFIRAALLVLIINLYWLRSMDINKHKSAAREVYTRIKENFELDEMIHNFIDQFGSPTTRYHEMKQFEAYLINEYPIMYPKLSISNVEEIYIHTIFQSLDGVKVESEKMETSNRHIKNFKNLLKLFKKKTEIETDKLSAYFLWTLIKDKSIEHYADEFLKQFGKDFEKMTELKDYALKYVSVDYLNCDINSRDLTKFTYFLMKYGPFEGEDNVIYCANKLFGELSKQKKTRLDKIFVKRLKTKTENQIVKELEYINLVDHVSCTNERFVQYIADIFQEYGHKVDILPTERYRGLDLVINMDNIDVGVNVVKCKKDSDCAVGIDKVQNLILKLRFNGLFKGILVTNNSKGFSDDAISLAKDYELILWNRDTIIEKVSELKKYDELNIYHIPFERISIHELDLMDGNEFAYYLEELFKRKGYESYVNPKLTRDKGVDVFIKKEGTEVGIQAKRYSPKNEVGVDAVSEIFSGLKSYNLSCGYVITTSYFTKEAIDYAKVLGITLWNRDVLIQEITEIKRNIKP